MKHIVLTAIIHFLLLSGTSYAAGEVSETGNTGMSFLRIVPSASTASLGGSATCYYQGASSQWNNPALLSLVGQRSVHFTHTEWVEGIRQEYASYATKTGLGNVGLAVQLFDSGDIEGYDNYGAATGLYSIRNVALSLAYAREIAAGVSIGAAYKKLFQKVSMETAGGYAVDAGIYYQSPIEALSFAATARNYGKMDKLKDERTKLPSDFALGTRYHSLLPRYYMPFSVVFDYVVPKYGDNGLRFGLELEPFELLVLRAGYRTDSDIEDISIGCGIILEKFSVDIAFTPMDEGFENALRFTLGIRDF